MLTHARTLTALLVGLTFAGMATMALADDTPAAAAMRKRLKTKITIEAKDYPLVNILEDIKNELDGKFSVKIEPNMGISKNTKLSINAKDKTAEAILDELCTKNDMGYIIYSKKDDRYDGWIVLRKSTKGKERGYEAGTEPKETKKESSRLQDALPQADRLAVVSRRLD